MPVLPLPLFAAIILLYVLVRAIRRGEITPVIRLVIALCALQATIIALRHYYGVEWLRFIQPVTAAGIPALVYVGFHALAVRPLQWPRDAWHIWAPAFALFCSIFAPATLDIVVPSIFVAYGMAILIELRQGADSLNLTRLETGELPVRIWQLLAVLLLVSAVSDGLIALDFFIGSGDRTSWIVGVFTSVTLLGLGFITLSRTADTAGDFESNRVSTSAVEPEDSETVARLRDLMEDKKLYRDPDLTLGRLARRLTLPVKTLSAAINRAEKKNVSQFVNDYRIQAACKMLAEEGESVTAAMLSAGFRTKSNFNREFRRVMGASPTEWLKSRNGSRGRFAPQRHANDLDR